MNLVGLMPSVLLRVDAQTTTRMAFQKTQRGQLNYVKSNAFSQSATTASATSSSPTVRQPASNDARNFSSWKNESQPGYKRNSLGSLRVNSKRKHIVDDDVHISSHDEQSQDDDITIASNIVQPAPQIPAPQIPTYLKVIIKQCAKPNGLLRLIKN